MKTQSQLPAVLALSDETLFRGVSVGAPVDGFGEVVFQTGMTGYQEVLTDPSYAGQIVAMTAPQIGNTGINAQDMESARPFCAGFVLRESSTRVSSWRSERSLESFLVEHRIPAIADIDTRALTRRLRERGAMRGGIAVGAKIDTQALIARVKNSPGLEGRDLVAEVTCAAPYDWSEPTWAGDRTGKTLPPRELKVVAYDLGIKRNILRHLVDVGCDVTVVPAKTSAADALALGPDGVFLSNGPGDPAAVVGVPEIVRELVDSGKPVFGICLGHQMMGLALGARTFKLPFGHHGANHPVKDLVTGKVEITSQNHGFCVDVDSMKDSPAEVTHLNLNDNTCEGLRLKDRPVFSMQYHPEASPGPHDASYLFRRFVETIREGRS